MGLFSFLFRTKSDSVRISTVHACPHSEPYIILDVETTGRSPSTDEIIQLSAIKYAADGRPMDFYDTYLNPGKPIPAEATKINGITNKMVAHAPYASQVQEQFLSFLGDALIVGYNIAFDLRFLEHTFTGAFVGRQCVDVLAMSRELLCLQNYKLGTVASHVGFSPKGALHNSFTDCEAVAAILHHLDEDLHQWTGDFRSNTIRRKIVQTVEAEPYFSEDEGFNYWYQGECERKAGNLEKAFQLFEKAQTAGYDCPAIFLSYAMAYRKLKDYEKEIGMLEDAINRFGRDSSLGFHYRLVRAIELSQAQRKKEKELQNKALEKAAKLKEREEKRAASASKPKKAPGRQVLQCSADGTIIKKYESIAAAAKEVGISTKCIRDAATGKQKHAGGFCWKYTVADVPNLDT